MRFIYLYLSKVLREREREKPTRITFHSSKYSNISFINTLQLIVDTLNNFVWQIFHSGGKRVLVAAAMSSFGGGALTSTRPLKPTILHIKSIQKASHNFIDPKVNRKGRSDPHSCNILTDFCRSNSNL